MPCFHPLPAWRSQSGSMSIGYQKQENSTKLLLPCGGCIGCRKSTALGWALRGLLELQDHDSAVFSTLTFNDENLPPTLSTSILSDFHRRLRKRLRRKSTRSFRHLSCGEYGETNHRAHYHSIMFGLSQADTADINTAWSLGNVKTVTATPGSIHYTCGYTAKKYGEPTSRDQLYIDYTTGEIISEWKAPFLQMSRRPGIGSSARRHTASWREYAILNGIKIPVPRYLHNAWKKNATPEQLNELIDEKAAKAYEASVTLLAQKETRTLSERLYAAEQMLESQQKIKQARRKL